jgi:hypothetical protein
MDDLIDSVAVATAECGMQTQLPNWLPADRHHELWELLFDLTVGALTAYRDAKRGWEVPEPSIN